MRDYLIHYGIKGQKWGKQRWTNPDGSLNDAGKRRYYGDGIPNVSSGGNYDPTHGTATSGRQRDRGNAKTYTYNYNGPKAYGNVYRSYKIDRKTGKPDYSSKEIDAQHDRFNKYHDEREKQYQYEKAVARARSNENTVNNKARKQQEYTENKLKSHMLDGIVNTRETWRKVGDSGDGYISKYKQEKTGGVINDIKNRERDTKAPGSEGANSYYDKNKYKAKTSIEYDRESAYNSQQNSYRKNGTDSNGINRSGTVSNKDGVASNNVTKGKTFVDNFFKKLFGGKK